VQHLDTKVPDASEGLRVEVTLKHAIDRLPRYFHGDRDRDLGVFGAGADFESG